MKRKFTNELAKWKSSPSRKPLLLYGARQVGKTYILKDFGAEHFEKVVYINLELNSDISNYFQTNLAPHKIISFIETFYETKIIPETTLIILDEIQSCERALTSLKYFCEDAPSFYVAAAGSLLGVAINREKYSFPVGKVDTYTLHPLDFEEFLWANNKQMLAENILHCYTCNEPLAEPLHLYALELFKKYLIVGGMPAVVKNFVETNSFIDVPVIQNKILDDYIADMAKYAENSESVRIRATYNSIPNQLAKDNKKFQYKVVQKGGSAKLFGSFIDWLNFAGLVLKCQRLENAIEPLAVYTDLSSFKLYMADTGLLVMKSGIAIQTILSTLEVNNIFLGAIAENYCACALAGKGHPLYYWESSSIAEIDFVLQQQQLIIPIEVKWGAHVRSRSLSVYVQKYNPIFSIRISRKNFGFENKIKSVPLYAVHCI